jgi:hypothetical protein
MTAYTTPWPKGRPPHMILVNTFGSQPPLENVIKHHQETCEECKAWANDHADDTRLWIYPHA